MIPLGGPHSTMNFQHCENAVCREITMKKKSCQSKPVFTVRSWSPQQDTVHCNFTAFSHPLTSSPKALLFIDRNTDTTPTGVKGVNS